MEEIDQSHIRFFAELSTRLNTLKELRSVYDEQMAFDFNATRFFNPGENKTSEILAFFLDPLKSHGQGNRFLRTFCESISSHGERNWDSLIQAGVEVRRESRTTHGRRIDIVITLGRGNEKFLIAIENKRGAADQCGQLRDYSTFLEQASGGQYCLLYLNPHGYAPAESSISRDEAKELGDKFQIISYETDIVQLLEKFTAICKSDKVNAFLRDFQHYLRMEYTGVYSMGDSRALVEHIVLSEANVEVAFNVVQNISAVQDCLYADVEKQLLEWSSQLPDPPQVICNSLDEVRRTSWAKLIVLDHGNWNVAFEFQRKGLENLYILIEGRTEGPVNAKVLERIQDLVAYEERSESRKGLPNIHSRLDYPGNWNAIATPWMEMVRSGGRYSIFTEKIIEWYSDAKLAVEDALGLGTNV